MPAEPPDSREVPLAWVGHDETPIVYANQFLIQFQQDESFIVSVGQATPPALIGTPDEIREQAEQIEFIAVRPITRVAITEPKLRELIAALEANLANFEKFRSRLDPRS